MLTTIEKEKLVRQLDKCTNVAEVFTILEKEYDLSTAKLGMFTKGKFIDGIIAAINMTNPKKL